MIDYCILHFFAAVTLGFEEIIYTTAEPDGGQPFNLMVCMEITRGGVGRELVIIPDFVPVTAQGEAILVQRNLPCSGVATGPVGPVITGPLFQVSHWFGGPPPTGPLLFPWASQNYFFHKLDHSNFCPYAPA